MSLICVSSFPATVPYISAGCSPASVEARLCVFVEAITLYFQLAGILTTYITVIDRFSDFEVFKLSVRARR